MSTAPHVMIVEARYYEEIVDELVRGAVQALEGASATYERFTVPGAFEIPAAIRFAIRARASDPAGSTAGSRFDAYLALGCVIRGETSHYDYICRESARALQDLTCQHSLALGYGILTVENREQARVRAAVDERNKGGEAARACLRMVELKRHFHLFPG